MSNNLNVIWLLIDSVRAKKSGGDDRDRLDIMDELNDDFTEFKNVMTSAPSTIMSLSAMMTGLPSIYLSKTYNDFSLDLKTLNTLPSVLQKYGYKQNGAIYYRVGRELLKSLFYPFPEKVWPKGLRHSHKIWPNKVMKELLNNFLISNKASPFFIYLHFNCRADINTTVEIEESLNLIKKYGYFDNSIIIICSDHGYPNPDTGYNEKIFKKLKVGHDLVMGDDNVMIPLFIRHPKVKPTILEPIISTVDLGPTLLDMLDINEKSFFDQSIGQSFFSKSDQSFIIKENDMFLPRSDNRFMFQDGRITVLRNNKFKYLLYHDDNKEQLFNIKKDYNEKHDLNIDNYEYNDELVNFKRVNNNYEKDLDKFQERFLNNLFNKIKHVVERFIKRNNLEELFIVTTLNESNSNIYLKLFKKHFIYCDFSLIKVVFVNSLIDKESLVKLNKINGLKRYIVIIGKDEIKNGCIKSLRKKFGKNNVLFFNYDLDVIPKFFPLIKYFINNAKPRISFYIKEPSLFFVDFYKYIKNYVRRRFVSFS